MGSTIGNMFPSSWDWRTFWDLTAFLSLMLAFMNLLPIPALDGGHVVFLLYEIVVRKPKPRKGYRICQVMGMIILFSLLIFEWKRHNETLLMLGVLSTYHYIIIFSFYNYYFLFF